MEKKRNIQLVVKKVSFSEAENDDDIYWAGISHSERLKSLFELRKIGFGGLARDKAKIEKVVVKRTLQDEEI